VTPKTQEDRDNVAHLIGHSWTGQCVHSKFVTCEIMVLRGAHTNKSS
jgi:hypothetical protein